MKRKKKSSLPLDITLPTRWGELSRAQVSRVAYYLSLGLDQTEFLVRLAAEFADLKPRGSRVTDRGDIVYRFYHRDRGNVLLTAEHVAVIADALRWTMGEVEPMAAPELDGYHTPDDALYDVKLEQYLTADSACSAYIRTQRPEPLRVLVAALYPLDKFDPKRLQAEAQRLRYLLPLWQLQAVFLWFTGAKQILAKKFPFVFSGDADPDDAISGSETLLGLLSSLNDGRVVDNEKLKETIIYEVFHELNLKIKTAKERK